MQTLTTINEIIKHKTKNTKTNVAGCVSFEGSPETIQKDGKTLKELETDLTDETSSIRVILWETDKHRVQNGQTYSFYRALVKTFSTNKYIMLNHRSSKTQEQITIQRTTA